MLVNKIPYMLLALLGEVAYLYPIYYLLAYGFQTPQTAFLTIWQMILVASFALLTNIILGSKSRRILTIVGVHIVFSFLVIYGLIITLYLPGSSFFHLISSLQSFFSLDNANILGIFAKSNLLVIIFWIWLRSIILFRTIPSYSRTTTRFELGLALIFITFLLSALLAIPIPGAMTSLIIFFLSQTGALAFTKPGGEDQGTFWVGLGFIAALLVPLALSLSLVLPLMNSLAGGFYQFATPILIFARDIFVRILLFLFKRANLVPQNTTINNTPKESTFSSGAGTAATPTWVETFFKYLGGAIMFMVGVLLLVLILYLVKKLILKLLKIETKQELTSIGKTHWFLWLRSLGNYFKQGFLKLKILILPFLPGQLNIFETYHVLLKWGGYKKYPREKHETPYEYCERLSLAFPNQQEDFKIITDSYVSFKYGNKGSSPEIHRRIETSLRKIYFSAFFALKEKVFNKVVRK